MNIRISFDFNIRYRTFEYDKIFIKINCKNDMLFQSKCKLVKVMFNSEKYL